MVYCRASGFSKTRIDRAGISIKTAKHGSIEYEEALKIINTWRMCHAYPIRTFQSTLRKKVNIYNQPIVAQRLKRLSTIIDKLDRYPGMELSRMNDIGGVRGVVKTISEVRELQQQYKDKTRFTHILSDEDDYISNPKPDGYRGVHLVFKYNNTLAKKSDAYKYEGLLVELQLRTKLQHEWATAVETIGFIRGEALKSQIGDKEWLRFFSLISSAFAYMEGSPLVPGHESLSVVDTVKEIAQLAKKLNAVDYITGFTFAAKIIQSSKRGGYYKLIILNIKEKTVTIRSYSEDNLKGAARGYAAVESEIAKGADIEAVLVSVGTLKSLKLAYPNYFLDIKPFTEKIKVFIEEAENGI